MLNVTYLWILNKLNRLNQLTTVNKTQTQAHIANKSCEIVAFMLTAKPAKLKWNLTESLLNLQKKTSQSVCLSV